jgi:hypothetical protein
VSGLADQVARGASSPRAPGAAISRPLPSRSISPARGRAISSSARPPPFAEAVAGCRQRASRRRHAAGASDRRQKKPAAALIENARIAGVERERQDRCGEDQPPHRPVETATSEVCAVTAIVNAK